MMYRFCDISCRIPSALLMAAEVPDAKMVRVPSAARFVPPETGQSIRRRSGLPASTRPPVKASWKVGLIVEQMSMVASVGKTFLSQLYPG